MASIGHRPSPSHAWRRGPLPLPQASEGKSGLDDFDGGCELIHYGLIGKSQDAPTCCLEPGRAAGVIGLPFVVGGTVDLYDQIGRYAGKISETGANRVLAAELGTFDLPVQERLPEPAFGLGLGSTQDAGAGNC